MILINREQNGKILYIGFKDHVQQSQIRELEESLPGILADLSPQFTILCDMTGMETMEFDCSKPVADLMKKMAEAGVGEVVRVIPDPGKDIGFGILSVFHYPSSLPVIIYKSLEDACNYLGISTGETGCRPHASPKVSIH